MSHAQEMAALFGAGHISVISLYHEDVELTIKVNSIHHCYIWKQQLESGHVRYNRVII